jgi:hypothetical protein
MIPPSQLIVWFHPPGAHAPSGAMMTGMNRRNFVLMPAAGMIALSACDDTKLVESWSTNTGRIQLKNILAVAMMKDGSRRRTLEEAMVKQIEKAGAEATASYELFPNVEVRDQEKCKQVIASKGFDGAVFVQLVDSSTEQYYQPGRYRYSDFPVWRRSMWGYWRESWPVMYEPGYSFTTRVVTMETTVYDVAKDEILWGGISKTTDPETSEKLIAGIANAAVKDMRGKGLLIAKA